LGKLQVVARLNRFLRLYSQLRALGVPEQADLRYSNGFAIRWRVPPNRDRATDLSG
jgi:cell division septal protein FtsQ